MGLTCRACAEPATHREQILVPSTLIRLDGTKRRGAPVWIDDGTWCGQCTGATS